MKRTPHVKNIVYETDGKYESVESLIFRSWERPNSREIIEFRSSELGYILSCLLNLNIYDISHRVTVGYQRGQTDSTYLDLIQMYDILNLYISDEFTSIYNDFGNDNEGTALTIKRVKQYIDFCEQNQQPYHTKFFDYLHYHRYFEVTTEILPVNGVEDMLSPSDMDNEKWNQQNSLSYWYRTYLENNRNRSPNLTRYNIDTTNRLGAILLISLCEIEKYGHIVRKCGNCGRYFIPENRSDTVYCDNISPQNHEMTCKQYGSQRLWYDRQKGDDLATLSRNILSAKSMLAKRNPDIPEYTTSYDYFRLERKKWICDVKEGRKSREEYRDWLLSMRSQKIIKGCCSTNNK